DKAEALTRTLEEMRMIAAEMARLETRESVGAVQAAEDREDDVPKGRLNTAARRISLRDESLRLPAGLSYELKERIVNQTIPEIDRRLERGVSREALFKAIDSTVFRPDPTEYTRKLAALTDRPEGENPERAISKEEYLESQRTLLRLCEKERLHLRELKATRDGNELEPYEEARLTQASNLTRRLKQGLGRNVSDDQPDRASPSRLFVSLPERGVGENAFRLPVSSVKIYETMAKIAAGERLPLQTWASNNGPEVRLELTEREADERSRIGAFLKNYVGERLRDPETRALNRSSVFRDARAAILNATSPEAIGRVAADFLRVNERRSEDLRRHRAAPDRFSLPSVMPLSAWERNLLFNGRAPEHHTAEMRELRLNYGLSRRERTVRIVGLREGRIEPSESLSAILQELETRKTTKAIAHFQASIINEKMNNEGKVNLHLLNQRIAPHERSFLYELSEERKRDVAKLPAAGRAEVEREENKFGELSVTRTFGAMPRENQTFREYMTSMGRIERQLLNEALVERGIEFERSTSEQSRRGLTITEARLLLPESLQREIRLRARNQAWQSLIPEEAFDRHPSPEAARISDTIAHIQEHLQERASIAQMARNDFVTEQSRLYESRMWERVDDDALSSIPQEDRERFASTLAPAETRKLLELDRYTSETRENVYRAFEHLDLLLHDFEVTRAHNQSLVQKIDVSAQPEKLANLSAMRPVTAGRYHPMPAATLQPPEKEIELQPENSRSAFSLLRVESDREWHFDSLREALSVQLSSLQDDTRGRELQQPQPVEHLYAQDR
ncbi:MAG: hypothetical protein ACREEM_27400, partial [Blastocatellia bacterium]